MINAPKPTPRGHFNSEDPSDISIGAAIARHYRHADTHGSGSRQWMRVDPSSFTLFLLSGVVAGSHCQWRDPRESGSRRLGHDHDAVRQTIDPGSPELPIRPPQAIYFLSKLSRIACFFRRRRVETKRLRKVFHSPAELNMGLPSLENLRTLDRSGLVGMSWS
jgi:hypothetical protein